MTPSQTDQLFSGLGLSSYVSKKDSGSIATKMLGSTSPTLASSYAPPKIPPPLSGPPSFSLEQKQKWLKDSESLQRLTSNEPLAPSQAIGRGNTGSNTVKDLTDSLLASNLNKISSSQTFTSGFVTNQATSSASIFHSPSMSGGFPASNQNLGSHTFQSINVQNSRPDLSGFDSLLPMSKPKQSINDIKLVSPQPNFLFPNSNILESSPSSFNTSQTFNNHSSKGTKPLSVNEINDFLS